VDRCDGDDAAMILDILPILSCAFVAQTRALELPKEKKGKK